MAYDDITEGGGSAAAGFSDALKNLSQYAENWAKGVEGFTDAGLEIMQNKAEAAKAALIKAGGAMVEGEIKGIDGASIKLKSAVEKLHQSIPAWAESVLGIHSPSTVMRDEVGEQIAAGVAAGITENIGLALGALDSLNSGMLTSEKEYLSEKARLDAEDEKREQQTHEKAYREKLSRAKSDTEIEKLKAAERERIRDEADEKYLKKLKETADSERETLNELKNSVRGIYSDIAEYANEKIGSVLAAQQGMSQKLSDFGELYDTSTITLEGAARDFSDLEVTLPTLSDIESDINTLREYRDTLQAVKDRGGVPSGLIDEITGMSVDEGLTFARALYSATDEDFSRYISQWSEKQSLAKQLSASLYKDDIERATDETYDYMVTKMQDAGFVIPEGFFTSGTLSAQNFGQAFVDELDLQMEKIRGMIDSFNLSLSAAGAASAAAQTNTSVTYVLNGSGETVSQQLLAARAHSEVERMRNG